MARVGISMVDRRPRCCGGRRGSGGGQRSVPLSVSAHPARRCLFIFVSLCRLLSSLCNERGCLKNAKTTRMQKAIVSEQRHRAAADGRRATGPVRPSLPQPDDKTQRQRQQQTANAMQRDGGMGTHLKIRRVGWIVRRPDRFAMPRIHSNRKDGVSAERFLCFV